MALVDGSIDEEIHDISYLEKDGEKNKVSLNERGDGKEIETIIRPMERLGEYTLVDINLITGRTHQIRATLKIQQKHRWRFKVQGQEKFWP